jgi:AcrR family transcriptional regulator
MRTRRGAAGPAGGAEASRAAELLWGGRQRATRGPRPTLTLDRIVDRAIAIADAEGLAALSMQRLAKQLQAGTMSLYRYVPGKDELVSLMVDAVVGRPPLLPKGDWRAALERWARRGRDVFLRHPWALGVVINNRVMGPNETAWTESGLSALSGTGLAPTARLEIVMAVHGYVRGAVQLEVGPAGGTRDGGPRPGIDPELLGRFAVAERYPILMAALTPEQVPADRPDPGEAEQTPFEFGLRLLLDGVRLFVDCG